MHHHRQHHRHRVVGSSDARLQEEDQWMGQAFSGAAVVRRRFHVSDGFSYTKEIVGSGRLLNILRQQHCRR